MSIHLVLFFEIKIRKYLGESRYGMLEFVHIKSIRFYDELVLNHHVE